jgi:DNA-binding SARP family transcriptional activator
VFYAVLGPFLAFDSYGDLIECLTPKHRQLLALLLLSANVAIYRDRLIEHLWNGRPPASARRNLTTYIAQLRRLLSPADPRLSPLRTVGTGYLLSAPPGCIDADIFDDLATQGRIARGTSDFHLAEKYFKNALYLWRGDALFDMKRTDELSGWAERLDEDRRTVTEDLFDVQLALGQHHEIVGPLAHWTTRHPFRERPHRQFMLALHRSDRSHDASIAYQRLRRTLIDQMGTEPAPNTRQLHQLILANDPALAFSGADLPAVSVPRTV